MPEEMSEPELQRALESAARHFRLELITDHEFAQKVLLDSISFSDELGEVRPDFSSKELNVIASFISDHSNEESLKAFACAYIADFHEAGIVEQRMEEIRPKLEKATGYFQSLAR